MAGDSLEENLNPVGAVYYGFSTLLCTPNALAQEADVVLGTQAGQARLTEVARDAGFSRVRPASGRAPSTSCSSSGPDLRRSPTLVSCPPP